LIRISLSHDKEEDGEGDDEEEDWPNRVMICCFI
jgi:hypothetical protein